MALFSRNRGNQSQGFTLSEFKKPSDCKDLEQIRFYVRQLCLKIEELEKQFGKVPASAYSLLAQYNSKQNALIYKKGGNSH